MLSLYRKYGFTGTVRLLLNLIRTRLFYRNVRLIRFPFDVRNRNHIDFGNGMTTGVGCRVEAYPGKNDKSPLITIGDNFQMNDYVHIAAGKSIKIGKNVLIASKVFITDLNHGSYGTNDFHDSPETLPAQRPLSFAPVEIEDNVWIGEFVCILPGIRIGKGSIIGAMSVVTKNIPPYTIAAGSPAKAIKKYNFDTLKWEKI